MSKELDSVVLRRDLPDLGLKAGDVGTVVHGYASGGSYEVEFVSAEGATIAVVTLSDADVRPLAGPEILHVRKLAAG